MCIESVGNLKNGDPVYKVFNGTDIEKADFVYATTKDFTNWTEVTWPEVFTEDTNVFLDFKKPIRSKKTKIRYTYIGNLSNGDMVFELPKYSCADKVLILSADQIDKLENYIIRVPEPYPLYLREREDGSRYITSEDFMSSTTDKCVARASVNFSADDKWVINSQ